MVFSHGPDDGSSLLVSSSFSKSEQALSQVAIHEAAHCVVGRYFNLPIGSVTIVPNGLFGGRVLGPESDHTADSIAVAHKICDKARERMPGPGENQDDVGSWHIYVKNRIIELVSGTISEEIFDPKAAKLPCGNDIKIANIFASSICSEAAVSAFVDYCRIEAHSILKEHWSIVLAIASALDTTKTLTGSDVDLIISSTISKNQMAAEIDRRARWRKLLV